MATHRQIQDDIRFRHSDVAAPDDEDGIMGECAMAKILHVRLRVRNLDESATWFGDLFGLQKTSETISADGNHLVFMRAPGDDVKIELAHSEGFGKIAVPGDLFHIAFRVNWPEFVDILDRTGITLSWGPIETPSGKILAFVDHPDGYSIEVHGYS